MSKPVITLTDRVKEEHCLAFYIFCAEPWEDFLLEAVKPLTEDVLSKGWAERYFFIRYWENGPHIRLRFFGQKTPLEKEVLPLVTNSLSAYLKQHPTQRDTPDWEQELSAKDRWYPNDSIQLIPYEPETYRYGGKLAMVFSEEHFQQSSDAVFQLLEPSTEWSYDRALGAAIQLHLSFIYAAGMDISEAREFSNFIFSGWFPRAYTNYGTEPAEELEGRKALTLNAFKTNFESQREFLEEYHQMLWEALGSEEEFEEEWLNTWISQVKELTKRLKSLLAEGKLELSPDTQHITAFKTPYEKQKLWFIYSSYVHMTNNRLGILNRDEAYLGYLISESLGSI